MSNDRATAWIFLGCFFFWFYWVGVFLPTYAEHKRVNEEPINWGDVAGTVLFATLFGLSAFFGLSRVLYFAVSGQ